MKKETRMSWLKGNNIQDEMPRTIPLRETKDYVLVTVDEADGYYIFNKITKKMEADEQKLPTALFQIDAIQSALDTYREDHDKDKGDTKG